MRVAGATEAGALAAGFAGATASTAAACAAYQIMAERIAGDDPHLSDAVKLKLRGLPERSFSAQLVFSIE